VLRRTETKVLKHFSVFSISDILRFTIQYILFYSIFIISLIFASSLFFLRFRSNVELYFDSIFLESSQTSRFQAIVVVVVVVVFLTEI
jgi:hypothetical protein